MTAVPRAAGILRTVASQGLAIAIALAIGAVVILLIDENPCACSSR